LEVLDLQTPGATPLAVTSVHAQGPVIDGTYAYFSSFGNKPPGLLDGGLPAGSIDRVPLDGGILQTVSTAGGGVFAVFNGALAWSSSYASGALWAQLPGGSPVLLVEGLTGTVAADATGIYVVGTNVTFVRWPK
jgi:hypothetical protein